MEKLIRTLYKLLNFFQSIKTYPKNLVFDSVLTPVEIGIRLWFLSFVFHLPESFKVKTEVIQNGGSQIGPKEQSFTMAYVSIDSN